MTLIISCLLFWNFLFSPSHSVQNDLPPRLQWNANGGYCGEVSLIQSGLYFGQYLSQYTARAVALEGGSQTEGELLLGVNDTRAANKMRLKSSEWNTDQEQNTDDFLAWVKAQVVQGKPVSVGVYMNQSIFHPGKAVRGDPDYDHIVTVFQIDTAHPLTDPAYYADDVIHFSDHGLYKERGEHRPYLFQSTFADFQKSRAEANLLSSPVYSLSNDASNYGLSVESVADEDKDTLPVRVATSVNSEIPAMAEGSNAPPTPSAVILTVTVSNLDPNVTYNLYRYNALDKVPTSHFNAKADQASAQWSIGGKSRYVLTEEIQSNETAVYRAVKTSAP